MLNVKKTLTKILKNCVRHKNQSVTVGSSQYDGYYYADCDITLPSGAEVIAVTNWSTTNNRSAITQRMWQVGDVLTVRVWTKQANTTVDIRVTYIGGGYCITLLLSTFVRCLGRRWSYVERKENSYEDISNGSYCRHKLYQNRRHWDLLGSRNDGIKLCGNRNVPNRIQKHFVNVRICYFRLWQFTHIRRHISIGTNVINKLNVYLRKSRLVHNWRRLWNQLGCNRSDIATTSERGWAVC